MKTHLLFLLLFCFSNSIYLFAQCYGGGGRSGGFGFRSASSRSGVIDNSPIEKFESWSKNVPPKGLILGSNLGQTQWNLSNESISKSSILLEFSIDFGWGFYLGKK